MIGCEVLAECYEGLIARVKMEERKFTPKASAKKIEVAERLQNQGATYSA